MCPCKLIRLRYDRQRPKEAHIPIIRSEVGGGSTTTMEERLDMETERSGIVSANATVRRRRRSSKTLRYFFMIAMKRERTTSRDISQVYMGELYTVWTCGCDHHYCSGEN